MVMLPEIWGKTIDSVVTDGADIIILTPAGKRFNQKMAESFSSSTQLHNCLLFPIVINRADADYPCVILSPSLAVNGSLVYFKLVIAICPCTPTHKV